jgi:hypothetical protein
MMSIIVSGPMRHPPLQHMMFNFVFVQTKSADHNLHTCAKMRTNDMKHLYV